MAPAVTDMETNAAPQVGGHIYVVTYSSQKSCHRAKMAACAKRAQYKNSLAVRENILGKGLH